MVMEFDFGLDLPAHRKLVTFGLPAGEENQKDPAKQSGKGHSSFAAEVLDVDSEAGQCTSGHSHDGSDCIVAVRDTLWHTLTTDLREVLREKGVEKRVAESDAGPNKPQQDSGCAKSPSVEKRADTLAAELVELALHNFSGRELVVGNIVWVASNCV